MSMTKLLSITVYWIQHLSDPTCMKLMLVIRNSPNKTATWLPCNQHQKQNMLICKLHLRHTVVHSGHLPVNSLDSFPGNWDSSTLFLGKESSEFTGKEWSLFLGKEWSLSFWGKSRV